MKDHGSALPIKPTQGSQSAASSETGGSRRLPSRGWYGLAFVLMLIGVAAFTASVNVAKVQVAESIAQMQRLVVPGSAELAFDTPGRYLVYYEKVGTYRGEDFDTTRIFRETPALDMNVQELATGRFLTVEQAKAAEGESQMFNDGRANSEFVFEIETPGRYRVSATHENPGVTDRLLLAVGPPVVGDLFSDWRGPFGGAAVLAFAFVISATTVLVTWMLRHGHVTPRVD
ncbi:MAG: hypothetical protein AAGG38_06110 [Planctomycetota bacterium]